MEKTSTIQTKAQKTETEASFNTNINGTAGPFRLPVDEAGYYGGSRFGGAYVPDGLKKNLDELMAAYTEAMADAEFHTEFRKLLKTYVGRPSPLYYARRLSEKYGARIYLKREDLNHTGAHKINNALGLALLARRMGKKRIIAETGAGQHGVATATVCALLGMECTVFMGAEDMRRQSSNVQRMRLLGARVVAPDVECDTLMGAVDGALAYWMEHPDSFYLIGSAVGPHPYPAIVAGFQSVISEELLKQVPEESGKDRPDYVIACVGGGSNAAGAFYHYIDDRSVRLIAVEAAGHGLDSGEHAATMTAGTPCVLHGSNTLVITDSEGRVKEPYSISAGLDYPGVGPLQAYLSDCGRVEVLTATDREAVEAGILLSRTEGIIPAMESSHALAALAKISFRPDDVVVVNLSGRGDKDVERFVI